MKFKITFASIKDFLHFTTGWYVEPFVRYFERRYAGNDPSWGRWWLFGPDSEKPKSYHVAHYIAALTGFVGLAIVSVIFCLIFCEIQFNSIYKGDF